MKTLVFLCFALTSHGIKAYSTPHYEDRTHGYTEELSCRRNCGSHLGSCSCTSSCDYYGDCCHDYHRECGSNTDFPTTSYGSCRDNCGRRLGSCSCSSSCQSVGNCCDDFYQYCFQSTDAPGSQCGGSLYSDSGTFTSPNYPNNYPDHADCVWYIDTNSSFVELELFIGSIECGYDYIRVYDGSSVGDNSLGDFCGTNQTVLYSTGSYLTVRFFSDSSVNYEGFHARYSGFDEGSCKNTCSLQVGNCSCTSSCERWGDCCSDYREYCASATEKPTFPTKPYQTTHTDYSCRHNCGIHFGSCSCTSYCESDRNCCHDYHGYCSSTTHDPGRYSCQYSCGYDFGLCSCTGSCVSNGDCCYDYHHYCDHTTSEPTTAGGSCRDNCGSYQGGCSCYSSCETRGDCCHDYYDYCAATTSAGSCGGSFLGSGTFTSPNYPNYYSDNSNCVWQLRASFDQRIYLAFTYLQLDKCCSCDYISVYDGPSVHSSLLGKVCNNTMNTFFSTSNYMTVVFRSDSSVVARGFSAEFLSSLQPHSGRVHCSSDSMDIILDKHYLDSLGYDGHSLYLNDPHCRPQFSLNNVVFSFPLNTCGNVRQFTNNRIKYTNNIYAYKSDSGEITRQSQLKMNVTCIMDQDSTSQILFDANTDGNHSITGTGRYNTSMAFYTSSSFQQKVTQVPYEVSLNENLYVQVDLRRGDDTLVIYIDTCVTSPSPFDYVTRAYYLVRNGCPVDSTYGQYLSGSAAKARFTFKAFQFLRATDIVYMQCTVLICPASDPNSRCRQGCNRRSKRSLWSKHESQTMVLGPITLKDLQKKEEKAEKQNEP